MATCPRAVGDGSAIGGNPCPSVKTAFVVQIIPEFAAVAKRGFRGTVERLDVVV